MSSSNLDNLQWGQWKPALTGRGRFDEDRLIQMPSYPEHRSVTHCTWHPLDACRCNRLDRFVRALSHQLVHVERILDVC